MISYIIPTHGREGVLLRHLQDLEQQTLRRDLWEAIVVRDGGPPLELPRTNYSLISLGQPQSGPAAARNHGAKYARGDVFLFVGDDALPHPHLLYRHWLNHHLNQPCAIQGFTGWYPQLPPLDFENFLYESGLQANWDSLKNKDGSWRRDAGNYCLTTNYSIHRIEAERLGLFDEEFPSAAWEDIALGFKGTKHALKTYFEPDAINYHAHRQTLDGFVRRQQTEGKSRLILCALHPEIAPALLDPNALRDYSADKLQIALTLARQLHFNSDPAVQAVRKDRWQTLFHLASRSGIMQGIHERAEKCKLWLAIPHLHSGDHAHFIVAAAASLERGDTAYAAINVEWALREGDGNWALWACKGEVELAQGNKREALTAFDRSVSLGPGEKWPADRLKEIL